MLSRFFNTEAVDMFAEGIVGELTHTLPPQLLAASNKSADRARQQMKSRLQKQLETFASTARLNVYQKATVGTRLEARLEAAGYPADFRKAFAYDVVKSLTVALTSTKT